MEEYMEYCVSEIKKSKKKRVRRMNLERLYGKKPLLL